MKTFSELFEALDTDNSTNGKLAALDARVLYTPQAQGYR